MVYLTIAVAPFKDCIDVQRISLVCEMRSQLFILLLADKNMFRLKKILSNIIRKMSFTLPSGRQLFVENITIDLNTLTEHERLIYMKRKSYFKHKEAILAKMKAQYDAEREAKISAGIIPNKRGRPRKYKPDSDILAERIPKDLNLPEKLAV
jgi:hypothetical protein